CSASGSGSHPHTTTLLRRVLCEGVSLLLPEAAHEMPKSSLHCHPEAPVRCHLRTRTEDMAATQGVHAPFWDVWRVSLPPAARLLRRRLAPRLEVGLGAIDAGIDVAGERDRQRIEALLPGSDDHMELVHHLGGGMHEAKRVVSRVQGAQQ